MNESPEKKKPPEKLALNHLLREKFNKFLSSCVDEFDSLSQRQRAMVYRIYDQKMKVVLLKKKRRKSRKRR